VRSARTVTTTIITTTPRPYQPVIRGSPSIAATPLRPGGPPVRRPARPASHRARRPPRRGRLRGGMLSPRGFKTHSLRAISNPSARARSRCVGPDRGVADHQFRREGDVLVAVRPPG
jgi:hypothetical protein